MDRRSEEFQIEVAATNMAITQAISGLTGLPNDHRPFVTRILEAGLTDLDNADYRNVAPDRRAAHIARIKARYTELVTTV